MGVLVGQEMQGTYDAAANYTANATATEDPSIVVIYPPAPAGSGGAGERYDVLVNGVPSPTYQSVAPSNAPEPQRGKTVSWVSFDSRAAVQITVARPRSRQCARSPEWRC